MTRLDEIFESIDLALRKMKDVDYVLLEGEEYEVDVTIHYKDSKAITLFIRAKDDED